jgi:hypothetical protein
MAEIAEHMRSKRIGHKTMLGYKSKLNTLKVFLLDKGYARHISDDGNVKVPLPESVIHNFFAWLSVNVDLPKKARRRGTATTYANPAGDGSDSSESSDGEESDSNDASPNQQVDTFAENQITISSSCMQSYKSALGWWYTEQRVVMNPGIAAWITQFIKGYKKTVADKKQRGVMSIKEGRSKLSFPGYNAICEHLMKTAPSHNRNKFAEGIFGWVFMTLSWNLMSRGENVRSVMLQHFDWKNDCMTVTFAKHKGDATGEGLGNEKHVYANPLDPHICPILALAVLIFTVHRGADIAMQTLLADGNSDDRFSKILAKIVQQLPENILGEDPSEIGTHSNRKGSTSYVLSFVIISAVQVYLRAGWSLGDVPDRYIFAGAGGDQVVGRTVAGLPINSKEFATLPPHFDATALQELNDIGWDNILEGYAHYPTGFKRVIPYLLASLLYHENYLRANLDSRHPLWNQKVFTTLIPGTQRTISDVFSCRVMAGVGVCKQTAMRATGVPPHLDIVLEVEHLKQSMADLHRSCKEDSSTVMAAIGRVPDAVKQCILDNFQVDGVVPITAADLNGALTAHRAEIVAILNSRLHGGPQEAPASHSAPGGNGLGQPTRSLRTFCWGGKLGRYVPQSFKYPSQDAKTMWDLWHYGNAAEGIQPYRLLADGHQDDLQSAVERVLLSKTALVMNEIKQIAVVKGLLAGGQDVGSLSRADSDHVFNVCYAQLLLDLYGARGGGATDGVAKTLCATLANKIYKKRKLADADEESVAPNAVNFVSP